MAAYAAFFFGNQDAVNGHRSGRLQARKRQARF
jgi:hypothetical protein